MGWMDCSGGIAGHLLKRNSPPKGATLSGFLRRFASALAADRAAPSFATIDSVQPLDPIDHLKKSCTTKARRFELPRWQAKVRRLLHARITTGWNSPGNDHFPHRQLSNQFT
jgi:hypothetical protein